MRRSFTLSLAAVLSLPFATGSAHPEIPIARLLPNPNPAVVEAVPAASASAAGSCTAGPRATEDRPDASEDRLLHIVYLVPADRNDEGYDVDGTLECSIRAQNRWFHEQSGGLRWRLDTYTHTYLDENQVSQTVELVDVTYIKSSKPASQLNNAGEVRDELEALVFRAFNKRYLSYVASDGGGACGDAFAPLGGNTAVDGKYSQVYLLSPPACRARDFGVPGWPGFSEMIAQQEMIHNDGIVPPGAPHGCGPGLPWGHVCTGPLVLTEGFANLDPERVDVMFPFVSVPLREKVLDRDNDDYFDHPFIFRDLNNSWYLEPGPA